MNAFLVTGRSPSGSAPTDADAPGIVHMTMKQLRRPALLAIGSLVAATVVVEGMGIALRRLRVRKS